jgi:hypothetical protein
VKLQSNKVSPRTSEKGLRELVESLSRELLLASSAEDHSWVLEHLKKLRARILAGGIPIQLTLVPLASAS